MLNNIPVEAATEEDDTEEDQRALPVECQESIIEGSDGGKACDTAILDATSSRLQTLEETKLSTS